MIKDELFERSPVRCFEKATGGLKAGELGLLSSKKGVGKSLGIRISLQKLQRKRT